MTKRTSGGVLVIIGLFMLFRMARISTFGFYRFGSVNTSAIVLVLLILSGIAVVVNNHRFTKGCLISSLCLLVLSLILGTEIYFTNTSLINLLLVLVPIIIGTGRIITGSFERKKKYEN